MTMNNTVSTPKPLVKTYAPASGKFGALPNPSEINEAIVRKYRCQECVGVGLSEDIDIGDCQRCNGKGYLEMREVVSRSVETNEVDYLKEFDELFCSLDGHDVWIKPNGNAAKPSEVKDFLSSSIERARREERLKSEKLWDLLDSIDTLPDMLHPSDVKGHEKCWKMMVNIAEKRHKILKSDGYKLEDL